jgi:hypothetical protein
LKRKIWVDNNEYKLIFDSNKELLLGKLKRENSPFDPIFEDVYMSQLTNDTKNPIKVFRVLKNEVLSFIFENSISYFWFTCDEKRIKVYTKIITDICLKTNHQFYEYSGKFVLFKNEN